MRKLTLFCFFTLFQLAFGQAVFLKLGNNITHYQYTENNINMRSEPGGSYELGYKKFVPQSSYPGLYYTVGLMINNFNQVAGSETSLYRWRTTYMGINGNVGFRIYKNRESNFISNIVFGMGINKFLKGTQTTNSSLYDLKGTHDFNKIFIQPSFGLEGIYNVNNEVFISVGYNYSKTFNFKSGGDENLNFVNNNFFIGTYIAL